MPDRAQYEAWIEETRKTQRKLKLALALGGVVAIALLVISRPLGAIAVVSVALFAIFGFWITSSHVTGWNTEITRLDRPKGELNRDGRLKRERD